MSNEILLQRDGGLATVVINRAESGNAMTRYMWNKLGEVMVRISADNDIRCVVLRGAGGEAFCLGDDLDEMETERCDVVSAGEYDRVMSRGIDSLKECRHPIVAMLHGECQGIGLGVAALADIRLCGTSSRFGVPLGRQGRVMPHRALAALVGVVGRPCALELLLVGNMMGAAEAHAAGLVHRVVADSELVESAYGVARDIAAAAPLAARWHKKFVNRLDDPAPLSAAEQAEGVLCFGTADFLEGRAALREGRKPLFRGH